MCYFCPLPVPYGSPNHATPGICNAPCMVISRLVPKPRACAGDLSCASCPSGVHSSRIKKVTTAKEIVQIHRQYTCTTNFPISDSFKRVHAERSACPNFMLENYVLKKTHKHTHVQPQRRNSFGNASYFPPIRQIEAMLRRIRAKAVEAHESVRNTEPDSDSDVPPPSRRACASQQRPI